MRWELGRSWPIAIEQGISGLPKYLHDLSIGKSRSGEGIQVEHDVNSKEFKRTDYLTPLFNRFRTNVIRRS
jgi:hypothetical protein